MGVLLRTSITIERNRGGEGGERGGSSSRRRKRVVEKGGNSENIVISSIDTLVLCEICLYLFWSMFPFRSAWFKKKIIIKESISKWIPPFLSL